MAGYPKLFIPLLLLLTATLSVSGFILIPSVMLFRAEMEYDWLFEWPFSQGSLRHSMTIVHAVSGWIIVWMIGAIWTIHMRSHWRRKENRRNGATFSVYWLVLVLTSLGIYYFGNPDHSLYSSLIHTALGALIPLAFWLHRNDGKKALAKSA